MNNDAKSAKAVVLSDDKLINDITDSESHQNTLLAAFQGKLQGLNVDCLPAIVQRRIKALKQLQLKTVNIEAEFYEEVHALECKYSERYIPFYKERSNIVNGIYEPTDEECAWESDEEEEMSNDLKSKVKVTVNDGDRKTENVRIEEAIDKGIPDFWLTIFKNVSILSEMIQEYDEPILKYLYDLNVTFLKKDPMGFIIQFFFAENEYFSNTVLTKEYHMKCIPEKDDPFSFEGPEIYKCKGCSIDWKKGKNVTIKTIKKNQKHKSRGSMRTVTKTVQNDSFFNFFSPPTVPEDPETEIDDETQDLLTSDFEIGHYIRERIVPRAVLYYTGEGLEDEDDDYDADDDDEENDDENDTSDDGDDHSNHDKRVVKNQDDGSTPADCRQQ